jgi:hypothetical protein
MIYQCFHKPFARATHCQWVRPIGVGGYTEEGMLSDATGDNISALNPYYNELTALYWIWKNTDDPWVGLYHYRRVLAFKYDKTWADPFGFNIDASDFVFDYFFNDEQFSALTDLMSVSDIVMPRMRVIEGTVADHYRRVHDADSWQVFGQVLHEMRPDLAPYLVLFERTNLSTAFNMFVMRRDTFNHYCSDLFAVINEVFRRIGPREDFYLKRYPGFLAERFLTLWMRVNVLRVAEVPYVRIDG